MGNWSTAIKGNDTTMDVYETFFDLYNEGQEASEVSAQVMEIFEDAFSDEDDRHAALFGLVLAQWETKSLDSTLFEEVKAIIESGSDLDLWTALEASEADLKSRKKVLNQFLAKISVEKTKPKKRA
jgi:hypothetical protein